MKPDDSNPYRPPNAPVADVSSARPLPPQPTTVLIALVLLWAKLSINSIRAFVAVFGPSAAFGQSFDFSEPAWLAPLRIATAVVFTVLVGWIILMIGSGHRWARLTYLFVVVFGLGRLAFQFAGALGAPVTPTVGLLVENALPLVAVVLLFTPSANAWFRHASDR